MIRNMFILFCLLFNSVIFAQENDSSGTIIVKLVNFRNSDGQVKLALFNSGEGFPDKRDKAIALPKSEIVNKKAEILFTDISYGTYAIGVHHDENSNDKFDSNWLKIPKEGYAASNDAKGKFGPPKYRDACFELKTDTLKMVIKVNY